jgi:PAS fold/Histidine kinase-, DNA gyrase B-, and HSP90-like ATPase/His Kinase A (phospho-acceptor) domain
MSSEGDGSGEALSSREQELRLLVETIPALVWRTGPEGNVEYLAQLRAALNVLPAYAWYAAPSGALTFVNKRTADYLCIPKDHPLRFGIDISAQWDDWVPLLHPDDRKESRTYWSNCLRTGEAGEHSYRVRNAHGNYRWFLARFEPLRASDGTLLLWVGATLDIEDLKCAEQALRKEHERLRQLESELAHMSRRSMMGELAASLAHEIAQPIATARNNARASMHFLDRSPPDLGLVKEALACVVDDADRAGDILDRIRDHIKKAPPRKERVDLNHAITDVVALAQGAIVKNSVSIQMHFTEGLSDIQVDRVQLQQVVLNLILNAVEAMGAIEVGVRQLSITTKQREAGGVIVAVRDSGPGIDPEHLDHIFDAFYTTKSSAWGWGYRSAGPSSTLTGADCGQRPMSLEARYFSSPCLARKQTHECSLAARQNGVPQGSIVDRDD